MKTEIKLEEIAGYLPYKLEIAIFHKREIYRKDVLKSIVTYDSYFCVNLINSITNCKPILRPISDLTKEIEVNGEKFVPIERLHISFDNFEFWHLLGINEKYLSMFDLKLLYEWHFDIHNLIERGLAIGINTLEK
jgi:hypothetical protein